MVTNLLKLLLINRGVGCPILHLAFVVECNSELKKEYSVSSRFN